MKNVLTFCLMAWLTIAAASIANAQNPPEPLASLFRMEGSWEGNANLVLDGNTFSFPYHFQFFRSPENSGLYMEETFTHPDLGTLKGYNLIGYNARDEKIHWFSVDNFGTTHDHVGYWKSPDHFYMEATEKHEGKKFEEQINIVFLDDGRITLTLVAKTGNAVVEELAGEFNKLP